MKFNSLWFIILCGLVVMVGGGTGVRMSQAWGYAPIIPMAIIGVALFVWLGIRTGDIKWRKR